MVKARETEGKKKRKSIDYINSYGEKKCILFYTALKLTLV
jgi:hypothetical protein